MTCNLLVPVFVCHHFSQTFCAEVADVPSDVCDFENFIPVVRSKKFLISDGIKLPLDH